MPNIDEAAKAWELDLAGRVGKAVLDRRKALKMTAVQLAERTKKLGYPISRVTITKIENNTRAGKLDVAELLILARALNMPPSLLLFPGYPDDNLGQLLPGLDAVSHEAVDWLSGDRLLPPEITDDGVVRIRPSSPGVEMVIVMRARAELQRKSFPLSAIDDKRPDLDDDMRQAIKQYRVQVASLNQKIDEYRAQLWGTGEGGSDG